MIHKMTLQTQHEDDDHADKYDEEKNAGPRHLMGRTRGAVCATLRTHAGIRRHSMLALPAGFERHVVEHVGRMARCPVVI